MTEQTVTLLITEMDEAWETLRCRLEGLTDEEFFWGKFRCQALLSFPLDEITQSVG